MCGTSLISPKLSGTPCTESNHIHCNTFMRVIHTLSERSPPAGQGVGEGVQAHGAWPEPERVPEQLPEREP